MLPGRGRSVQVGCTSDMFVWLSRSLWEVRTRENPSNLQYTTATLGLHIDLTYYDYTPGVCSHGNADSRGGGAK